jgi:PGF-CTERM protein
MATKRVLTVVVTVLVVAGLVYVGPVTGIQPEEEEPNDNRDNAQTIETDESMTGDLTEDDNDWYAFEVEAGETVNITVDGEAASGNIHLRTFMPENGKFDSGVQNGTATFGRTAVSDGIAYLRVQSRGAAGAEYSFTVDTYRTDWFEHNDDQDNATRLYENPLPSATARSGIGDSDWFAFDAEEGETITAMGWSLSGNTVAFGIFRPDGSTEKNNVADGGLTLETTAATDGTAYFRAQSHHRTPGSAYNFTVVRDGERLGLPNDRFERGNPPIGNQNRENAPEITSGTYTDLAIVNDDRDVFAVALEEGERVRAAIDFTHEENDLALALTDDTGTEVESADTGTDGEQVAFTAPSEGTYYLRVNGESGASTTYDMDLAVLEQTDVTLGPGGLTAPPDTTTTVNVTVTGASAGLSNADLTLRSTNTSVLQIQSIDAVGNGAVSATVADDGGTATANITGLDQTARGAVTVAEVTVATVGNGSATLAGSASIAARESFAYPLGTVQRTTVTVAPDVEVSTTTPTGDDDGGDEAGDGDDGGDTDGADEATDAPPTSNGTGPGFGPVVAVLVLAGAALLARRR